MISTAHAGGARGRPGTPPRTALSASIAALLGAALLLASPLITRGQESTGEREPTVGGTGQQTIGGTGERTTGGTGEQTIGGTGEQSIGGAGEQSIGGQEPRGGQPTIPPAAQDQSDALIALPVTPITVEGNRYTDTNLILRTAALREGEPVPQARLERALRDIYGLGLFASIHVRDWLTNEGTRGLAIVVTENPRVIALSFEGNRKISGDDLKSKIDLRTGQVLTQRRLFESRRAIQNAYEELGYASADVDTQVGEPENGAVRVNFRIQEGDQVDIRGVRITGNEAFTDDELRGVVELKPNALFRRKRYTTERMREDMGRIEEFYRNRGFKDARVAAAEPVFTQNRSEVRLEYRVEEGPRYAFGDVAWTGNEVVSNDALMTSSAIRTGQPFSQARIDQTTGAAYELYTERGYLLELMVMPEVRTEGDTVHVHYTISEGRPSTVHEVQIRGNTRTREHVIRRELSLVPGQLLRRSTLMRSQRDVFALGFFEDVQVDYQPAGIGSAVDVSFNVKEKSSGTATAGAAYSSDTGLTGFVEFGHNNVFGRGQSVAVHLERGARRETFDISFTEPWFLGTPTSAGIQVYNTVRDFGLYTEKQRGGAFNLGRPWFFRKPDYSRVFAGYSLEDIEFTNLGGLSEFDQVQLRGSTGLASRLNLSFSRNSTDNPFQPRSGSRTLVRGVFAGGVLGGELDYFKPSLDHRVYFVPFGSPALMIRNRLSWVGPYNSGAPIPASETFRIGGTRSDYLRGYPDYWIVPPENIRIGADGREIRFPGGRMLYTFSSEYQFPIVNPVRGLFFVDAGNTWNSARDFGLNDLKFGLGAGIRLEIPMLGPVGFDYAYGVDRKRWQAHFIIGPAF